jgi:hypothetical protein
MRERERERERKLARPRRPKSTCSPAYADYRPTRNAVISWDMSHTLRGERMGGIGKRKEI